MTRQDGLTEIDQYAIRNIECQVRALVGRYGITLDDRDDLIQQLFLEYLERVADFDPERGRYKTFVNCLVRNQVVSLIRARKRQFQEVTLCALPPASVQDPDDETAVARNSELSEDAYRMATGQASRSAAELLDLRLDVNRAVNSMPPQWREIGNRVVAEGVSDVGRALGRSQTRIYQLLWKMRTAFVELGLAPATGGIR
jgi:RNA polymerase sigma-70 factor (ECF subfamily)